MSVVTMIIMFILFNFVEFNMLFNIQYSVNIASKIKNPWIYLPYAAVPNLESEGNHAILVFGKFYSAPLLPELDTCDSIDKSIVRSSVCVPHDVVIVHFIQYKDYLKICENYPEHSKATAIIY
ncbi:hypothetical protein RF11_07631 [Thelohanellus kitauei]|uniref:Uncharacterized protein n=1 Tax=Thelohanellus kitauei TaxID=669202 RepID=A0A0C2NMG0_THEKT|nr:hypothetical protein RF11_07631 [Thelohanellus kitauei]